MMVMKFECFLIELIGIGCDATLNKDCFRLLRTNKKKPWIL